MPALDHKHEVGERLRQVREALGFSMAEFARMHDLDRSKLNQWEKGKHYTNPPKG
jgi:transcriptional regulator with XRE-family HTH domain